MKKVIIVYGNDLSILQRRAIEQISAFCLECGNEYPVCYHYNEEFDKTNARIIYLGTKANNPKISELSPVTLTKKEEYYINVKGATDFHRKNYSSKVINFAYNTGCFHCFFLLSFLDNIHLISFYGNSIQYSENIVKKKNVKFCQMKY